MTDDRLDRETIETEVDDQGLPAVRRPVSLRPDRRGFPQIEGSSRRLPKVRYEFFRFPSKLASRDTTPLTENACRRDGAATFPN